LAAEVVVGATELLAGTLEVWLTLALDVEAGEAVLLPAWGVRAGARFAAWWWCARCGAGGDMCWSSSAPPAVTTAAARIVTT
jgi:hypothetical protein